MNAETLRRAASLMRDRAEAAGATEGWWGIEPLVRALDGTFSPPDARADAKHIASWRPAVALAVADWLDDAATLADETGRIDRHALAVARAYLGED